MPKKGKSGKPEGKGLSEADVASMLESLEIDENKALDDIMGSVVKVFCSASKPNYTSPWQKERPQEFTSSGFFISGNRIICNAHGVAHHSVVRVRKHGSSHKAIAKVLHVSHECDLAVLAVEEEGFWTGVKPLEFGPVPSIRDQVICVGYPTGGDNISVTQGIVSRVAMSTYSHSGEELLTIQIDAAINSGNSGGPALMDGRVVGVAFESLADADNIGYIIPAQVVQHVLKGIEMKKASGICTLNASWQNLENTALRSSLNLPKSHADTGILVTKVPATSKLHGLVKPNDVLVAFDKVPIGADATVPFRGDERVDFSWLVSSKFVGDKAKLSLLRNGEAVEIETEMEEAHPLAPLHMYDKPPSYMIFGGLVFTTLSVPYLAGEFTSSWDRQAPLRMIERVMYGEKSKADEEVVVLAQILTAVPNIGYEDFDNSLVVSMNGTKIDNLKHLERLLRENKEKFVRFEVDGGDEGGVIVIDVAEASKTATQILEDNNIPFAMSADLRAIASGGGAAAAALESKDGKSTADAVAPAKKGAEAKSDAPAAAAKEEVAKAAPEPGKTAGSGSGGKKGGKKKGQGAAAAAAATGGSSNPLAGFVRLRST